MLSNFLFNFINILFSVFLTKLLTLAILFSTAVRALEVAKLVKLGILPLTTFILVATLVMSGILFSIFLILALYTTFLINFYYIA